MRPLYTTAQADPTSAWLQMVAAQQGLDPGDAELAELQAELQATQPPVKAVPGGAPWGKPQVSITRKTKVQTPEQADTQAQMLELVRQYGAANQAALGEQEKGVNVLAQRVQEMRQGGPSANWKPIASFLDTMTGGNLAANVPTVQTGEQFNEKMLGLENELQKARAGLSKEKAEAMEKQIAAYKASKDSTLDESLKMAKIGFYSRAPGMQEDRQMFQAHKDVIGKLKGDKALGQRLAQSQNLDNALKIVDDAEIITPQQIHEFQQAIRKNIGIGGTSGVTERDETYIKSMGMNVANVKQFLTGNPQDVAGNKEILKHLRDLVRIERTNINKQAEKRIKALTAGYEHMYEANPQFKKDLDTAAKTTAEQYQADAGPEDDLPVGAQKSWQGKTYEYVGGGRKNQSNWKVVE